MLLPVLVLTGAAPQRGSATSGKYEFPDNAAKEGSRFEIGPELRDQGQTKSITKDLRCCRALSVLALSILRHRISNR